MEQARLAGLRAELALLEAQDTQLSEEQRHLAGREFRSATRQAQERKIAEERRRLRRRIDELRELLSAREAV